MIISTTQLDSILHDDNLIIADTRSFKEYDVQLLECDPLIDLFAFHWIDTSSQGLENFNDQCKNLFSFLGVTSEKKVVFYDTVSGMLAARGVWMLCISHMKMSRY